jgi:hypothetical protein
MAELERLEARLGDLAGAVAWPPAPDLAAGVRAGIAARARRRRLRLVLLAAALALALVGGGAIAATPALRGAVIQWVPGLPQPSPSSAPGGGTGADLSLGQRYPSVADAERAAGFQAVVPAALGQPDEVWYRSSTGVMALVYRPRPGLPPSSDPRVGALVMEARASPDNPAFVKLVGQGTTVTRTTVNGGPGLWITGAPHGFAFPIGAEGQTDSFRLAGSVLLWNQAGLVVRIESGLDEGEALRIAGTAG